MVVLGYLHDGVVYMATDTGIVAGNSVRNELSPQNYKVRKMAGGLLVGIVGDIKVRQRLMNREDLFPLDEKGTLSKTHIVEKIVPAIYRFLNENGLGEREDNGKLKSGLRILLAQGEKLYVISDRLWTARLKGPFAVGELSGYCEGALREIDANGDVEAQLGEILERATASTKYISAPFVCVNTKDLEYRVLEGKNDSCDL